MHLVLYFPRRLHCPTPTQPPTPEWHYSSLPSAAHLFKWPSVAAEQKQQSCQCKVHHGAASTASKVQVLSADHSAKCWCQSLVFMRDPSVFYLNPKPHLRWQYKIIKYVCVLMWEVSVPNTNLWIPTEEMILADFSIIVFCLYSLCCCRSSVSFSPLADMFDQ